MKKILLLLILLIPTVSRSQSLELKTVVENISCNGCTNGSIKIDAIPYGNYRYTISQSSFKDTNSTGKFTDLKPGVYKVSVIDGKKIKSTTLKVIEPKKISIKYSVTKYPTKGTMGSVYVTLSGGSTVTHPLLPSFVSVNTDQQVILTYSGKASEFYMDLFADTYFVRIEDENGCLLEKTYKLLNKK